MEAATTVSGIERRISKILTTHEGYWRELAHLLRAMESDEEAASAIRRRVRDAMGYALLAGYEGCEPTPPKPRVHATNIAQEWVGVLLLRDVGPPGLKQCDWLGVARALTHLAGPRISTRPAAG
jgi:hypothetical protein